LTFTGSQLDFRSVARTYGAALTAGSGMAAPNRAGPGCQQDGRHSQDRNCTSPHGEEKASAAGMRLRRPAMRPSRDETRRSGRARRSRLVAEGHPHSLEPHPHLLRTLPGGPVTGIDIEPPNEGLAIGRARMPVFQDHEPM
jgi:hypothetical protein